MKIYMNPEVYECAMAEQHKDGVHLLNEDGSIIVIIASAGDIDAVEGGEITIVDILPPTTDEVLNAMLGVL